MKTPPLRRSIQPKISTMPLNNSEAAKQLELYKMVTKRQRIQQELQFMEQRLQVLREQLSLLNNQIETTEKNIQTQRQSSPNSSEVTTAPNTCSPQSAIAPNKGVKSSNYQTFYLEY